MEMVKIAILSGNQGYMMMSLRDKIEEAGFETVTIGADIKEISQETGVGAYLVYCDEELLRQQRALTFLKDCCAESGIPIFVIGNREEMDKLHAYLSNHLIVREFERPVNSNELVEVIRVYMEKFGSQTKKKILVVDDSGAMLRNVKGWLGDKYQVILANSGAMAIKYLATSRPDLVLLDYEMPIVDGKKVFEMIRNESEFQDVPVIFLTGKDDRESVMQVMALRPEGYLLKTMEPGKIIEEVDAFFERQKFKAI
ncbi:MAG: response regulator [Lachnospiraceae bacterium]|nr:response regulator [Lachnospiraceae bacterium]